MGRQPGSKESDGALLLHLAISVLRIAQDIAISESFVKIVADSQTFLRLRSSHVHHMYCSQCSWSEVKSLMLFVSVSTLIISCWKDDSVVEVYHVVIAKIRNTSALGSTTGELL
jgi:hypothetical protein